MEHLLDDGGVLPVEGDGHGHDEDEALDELLGGHGQVEQEESVVHHRHDQAADDDRAELGVPPPREGDAAQEKSQHGVDLGVATRGHSGVAGTDQSKGRHDRTGQAANEEGDKTLQPDPDARLVGHLLPGADGPAVFSEGGIVEDDQGNDGYYQNSTILEYEGIYIFEIIVGSDGATAQKYRGQAAVHKGGAQSGDEGVDPQENTDRAVDGAHGQGGDDHDQNGQGNTGLRNHSSQGGADADIARQGIVHIALGHEEDPAATGNNGRKGIVGKGFEVPCGKKSAAGGDLEEHDDKNEAQEGDDALDGLGGQLKAALFFFQCGRVHFSAPLNHVVDQGVLGDRGITEELPADGAVLEGEDPVTHADELGKLLRDHEDGLALILQVGEDPIDVSLDADVNAAGGAVKDVDLGLAGQPLADGHLLLVAAREVHDVLLGALHLDGEGLPHSVGQVHLGLGGDQAALGQLGQVGQADVILYAARAHQGLGVPVLGDVGHFLLDRLLWVDDLGPVFQLHRAIVRLDDAEEDLAEVVHAAVGEAADAQNLTLM